MFCKDSNLLKLVLKSSLISKANFVASPLPIYLIILCPPKFLAVTVSQILCQAQFENDTRKGI